MNDMKIRITALTDVGLVRDNNEDNFIVCCDLTNEKWMFSEEFIELHNKGAVFAVADGMGGHNAGEIASDIAIKTVKKLFSEVKDVVEDDVYVKQFMCDVVKKADEEICDFSNKHPDSKGMGTTIVLAWILRQKLFVAWCGDSRAYVFDNITGLIQISKDHSYVQELVDNGVITKEQAFYHPNKNIITRSLGNEQNKAHPEIIMCDLCANMRILLCSDGLNGMIEDEQIEKIIRDNKQIDKCKEELIKQALNAGGGDNVTIVLCDVITKKDAERINADDDKLHDTLKTGKKRGFWGLFSAR